MTLQSTNTAPRFLVVGPAWVGDMVMADSFFQLLKKQYPESHLSVLSPNWCLPLLERMAAVDEAISFPLGHGALQLKTRWRFGKALAHNNYTQSFVLPNSWKSAMVPLTAKVPLRTGWLGEARYGLLNDHRRLDKSKYPTMISRFNALALPAGASLPSAPTPTLTATAAQISESQTTVGLANTAYVALCPGAEFGPAKRWPPAHYAQLCVRILESGQRPVLMGSPKDQATTAEIFGHLPQNLHTEILDLAGKTNLTEAIDILAGATAVVTNDSGLMHIAAAVGRPIVAIYGPTSTVFTPPASEQAKLLQLNLACQPCHQRTCPLEDDKKHACMTKIPAEQVFEHLEQVKTAATN